MSCPQDWGARIHAEQGDEKESAFIIRNVPESIRRELKSRAAREGKPMQGLVLELITRYVAEKESI
jgi:plasmid stability protein